MTKARRRSYLFHYRWPLFDEGMFVSVGQPWEQLFAGICREKGLAKGVVADYRGDAQVLSRQIDKNVPGFVYFVGGRWLLLWLSGWYPKTSGSYDVLMHETHHMVLMVGQKRGFYDEAEASAYLQARLHQDLRERLDKRPFP